jgi:hypothetical protein
MSKRTNEEIDKEKEEEAEKAQLAEYESDTGSGSGLAFDAYVFDKLAKVSKKEGKELTAKKYTDMADDVWMSHLGNQKFGYEPHGTGEPGSPAVLRALQLEPGSAEKASELYGRYIDKPYRRRTGEELNETFGPDSGPIGLFEPKEQKGNLSDDIDENDDLGFDYDEKFPPTPEKEKGGRLNKKRRNTKRNTKRYTKRNTKRITKRTRRKVTKRRHNRRK